METYSSENKPLNESTSRVKKNFFLPLFSIQFSSLPIVRCVRYVDNFIWDTQPLVYTFAGVYGLN